MDIELPNVNQVLGDLQKKIAFLFQELMGERNSYKQKCENLNIKLEQLFAEAKILKNENEALREIFHEFKNIIYAGVSLFRKSDFPGVNLKSEHEIELENLKKKFLATDGKLNDFESKHTNDSDGRQNSLAQMGKSPKLNKSWNAVSEAEIQREFELLKEVSLSTQFFNDKEADSNKQEKTCILNKSNAESVLQNLFERKPQNQSQIIKELNDAVVVYGTESFHPEQDDLSTSKVVQPLSKESFWDKSPVFKDFGNHRQNGILVKDVDMINSSSAPLKSVNENIKDKPKNLLISPWKMPGHFSKNSSSKECSSPKLAKRKLDITSPKRSHNIQLKKSNSREAEISISGVRKLTQTILNIDCYKKKNPEDWKKSENSENRNFEVADNIIKCEEKLTMDTEEDDFITESPKSTEQLSEDVSGRNRNENILRDVHLITPPETSDADLDETFISSSIIRQCKLTKRHHLEKADGERTPLKRPAREKSPEFDSVPYVYKREPIRKKAERMKLPGQACLNCNKYYENALGDVDTQNLKKILNKCSRHRDKNSPTLDETIPDYWKPYLTWTTPPKEDHS